MQQLALDALPLLAERQTAVLAQAPELHVCSLELLAAAQGSLPRPKRCLPVLRSAALTTMTI